MSKEYYICEVCNFKTKVKHNYDNHLRTLKHYNNIQLYKTKKNETEKIEKNESEVKKKKEKKENKEEKEKIMEKKIQEYRCQNIGCGKGYKTRGGLWKHKKNCTRPIELEDLIHNEDEIEEVPEIEGEYVDDIGKLKYDNSLLIDSEIESFLENSVMIIGIVSVVAYYFYL